jgi:hypothetical protein
MVKLLHFSYANGSSENRKFDIQSVPHQRGGHM